MHDVIAALTVAYDLLVGGLLVPVIGAMLWRARHDRRRAGVDRAWAVPRSCVFLASQGIDSDLPIYFGLAGSFVVYVAVSLRTAAGTSTNRKGQRMTTKHRRNRTRRSDPYDPMKEPRYTEIATFMRAPLARYARRGRHRLDRRADRSRSHQQTRRTSRPAGNTQLIEPHAQLSIWRWA